MRTEASKMEESTGVIDAIRASAWLAGFKTVRCSSAGCSRWLTQRHLTARKVGVSLQGKWYCGYGCFAGVAAERLSQLVARDSRPQTQGPRMPLSLLLIQRGFMTQTQYRQAARELDQSGEEIGEALVRVGYITEKQLMAARSMQWACPVFSPTLQPGPDVRLPLPLMRRHSMAPLHYVAATDSLLVGFVCGIEYGVLRAVEEVTGCNTQSCLITQSNLEAKLQEYRDRNVSQDDLVFEGLQTAGQMTETLCSYGRAANADRISIGRCGDYLWARMNADGTATDLLFKAT